MTSTARGAPRHEPAASPATSDSLLNSTDRAAGSVDSSVSGSAGAPVNGHRPVASPASSPADQPEPPAEAEVEPVTGAHPKRWAFWRQRPTVVGYMLGCELLAAAGIAIASLRGPLPGLLDFYRLVFLAICATVHLQLSRRQEESRRSRKSTVQIDLVGIWSFAAVVVLPVPYAVALILISRTQRWYVARRPLYRYTFSTASVLLGAVATHTVLAAIGPLHWIQSDILTTFTDFVVLIVAGLTYFVVQAIIIGGGALIVSEDRPTVGTVLGTREDNVLEAMTIALGLVATVLLVNLPAALAIMVMVSVVGNRVAEVRQLQHDVRTDSKTGLLNMRGWHEVAQREMTRAAKGNGSVALLMVDLDHFKSINDTWGHPAGDDVLQYVSQALRHATRPTDVIGRFGGEEFVLLLPDADLEVATAAGERIRSTVARLEVATTDKRGGSVAIRERTTSVGIAVFPDHGSSLDSLLQAADAAVYEAKELGRNQVRLAFPRPR